MSSDSFKRRLSPKPPAIKCKQCGVEKAKVDRADGLGVSCGTMKDRAAKKAADWAEQQKR
jgi:hypothetical protein